LDRDLGALAQLLRALGCGDEERGHAVRSVRLAAARDAGVELAHTAQALARHAADAEIVVDPPEWTTAHVQDVQRHEHAVEEAGLLTLEVLLIPPVGAVIDFLAI